LAAAWSTPRDHRVAMSFAVASLRPRRRSNPATWPTWPPFQLRRAARSAGSSCTSAPEVATGMSVPVIAIDGQSGSGKGTVARLLAGQLGWHCSTAGAVSAHRAGGSGARLDPADEAGHATSPPGSTCASKWTRRRERVLLDGRDVTRELRAEATATWPRGGRDAAVRRPCSSGSARCGPPGRWPMAAHGTVGFPLAGLKVFLTASAENGPAGAITS